MRGAALRPPAFVALFVLVALAGLGCGGDTPLRVDAVRLEAPNWSPGGDRVEPTARLIDGDREREVRLTALAKSRAPRGWREWSVRSAADAAPLGRLALASDAAALLQHLAHRDAALGAALEPSRLVRLATRDGERLGLLFDADAPGEFAASGDLDLGEAARLVAVAQALGAWQAVAKNRYPIAADGTARLPLFTPSPLSDWRALRQRSLEFFLPPALGRQFATRERFRGERDRALAQVVPQLTRIADAVRHFESRRPEAARGTELAELASSLDESAAAFSGYLDSAWVELVVQGVTHDSARLRILVHSVVDVRIDAVYVELPGKVLVTESAALAGLRLTAFDDGGAVRAHLGRDRVEFRLAREIAPHAPEVDTFQSAELEFTLTGLEALGSNAWPLLAALRLRVSNGATDRPVPDSHVQRSFSLVDPDFDIGAEPTIEEFLTALPRVLFRSGPADPASLVLDRDAMLLTLPAGDYRLAADFVPPAGYGLVLAAGVSLQVEPGRSLLIRGPLQVRGTPERPVRVRGTKLAEPWGVLALQGRGRSSIGASRPRSEVRHLELSGGSQARLKGVVYTGQLSVHHQDLSLQHAVLSRAFADDSLNVKYGEVDIRDSRFSDNQSDAVDLDWVAGRVTRSFFARSGSDGGDGIDLSGSAVVVSDSVFGALGDKCLSVGEASSVRLSGSLLRECDTGLASKDDSLAEVTESLLLENRRDFAAYVKKPIFGGGSIRGRGLLLVGTAEPDSHDAASEIVLEDAVRILRPGESGLDLEALRNTHEFSSARFRSIANTPR